MKYARLTKEQFEEMNAEFSNFLATQAIDKAEWDQIKIEKPEVAEQELDVFSDLVWEGVLSKTEFLEHFSKNHIFVAPHAREASGDNAIPRYLRKFAHSSWVPKLTPTSSK